MAFFQWLQDTPYIQFVGGSDSIWGFPLVLVFHTVGLALVVGTNAIVNLRVLGAGGQIPFSALLRIVRVMWIGFAVSVVSGAVLFLAAGTTSRAAWIGVFYVKLSLIAVALVVTYLIRPVLRREPAFGRIGAPPWAKVMAVTSMLLWAAAIGAARMMALAH
jgi:hypothetical protein